MDGATARALEFQECSICFDPLCSKPSDFFVNSTGRRTCRHYFHHDCVTTLPTKRCPICRQDFTSCATLTNPLTDPAVFFKCVDANNNGTLDYEEVQEALKAVLPLDWKKIEADSDKLWTRWDRDKNGNLTIDEFCHPDTGVVDYLRSHYPQTQTTLPPPNIRTHKHEWFQYWDADNSGSLDKSEIIRAVIKTLRYASSSPRTVQDVRGTIDAIWGLFDSDNSGVIEISEFLAPDNLADTLIATIAMS